MSNCYPALIPYLAVHDVKASIAFYQDAFGFALEGSPMVDEKGMFQHAEMRLGDCVIMFGLETDPQWAARSPKTSGVTPPLNLYVYIRDVDDHYTKALTQGAISQAVPEDMFWGDRRSILEDINGFIWCFATKLQKA